MRLPLWRMDGLDDAFYVEVARLWTHGLPPYLTVYDVKPPGFFALLAVAVAALGPTLDALRALAVVGDAATAVALLMLGRRFGAPAVGRRCGAPLSRCCPSWSRPTTPTARWRR